MTSSSPNQIEINVESPKHDVSGKDEASRGDVHNGQKNHVVTSSQVEEKKEEVRHIRSLENRIEFLEGKMHLFLNVFADLGRFINAPPPRPAPRTAPRAAPRAQANFTSVKPPGHKQGPRQKRKERLAAAR
jgi:hypothetical protein